MFYRKARLIQILNADIAQAKENLIVLRKTNAGLREEVQSNTDSLARSAAEIATLTEQIAVRNRELATMTGELEKLQEKLARAQEELREARQEAQASARRGFSANLSEVNAFPGEDPEKNASPGIGDYQSGRTHPERPDGEWR